VTLTDGDQWWYIPRQARDRMHTWRDGERAFGMRVARGCRLIDLLIELQRVDLDAMSLGTAPKHSVP
jgi:hypothetical protein